MAADVVEYTGTDNLEVMQDAINYNKFLIDLVSRFSNGVKSVIDLGAGIGTFAQAVQERGFHVHCIEPDTKQALRIKQSGFSVDTDIADIKAQSCEFLYSFNVLEHIEDDQGVLKDCHRIMKNGGRILIYVPAFQVIFSSMDRKVGHVRRYTRTELVKKVENAGFKIETSKYVDSLGFLASLLFKWIGNDSGTINKQSLIFYDRVVFPISRFFDFFCGKLLGKNTYVVARKV